MARALRFVYARETARACTATSPTSSSDNRFYRVDHRLRGDKVEVRYDPFAERSTRC